jgi:hypothetical protein
VSYGDGAHDLAVAYLTDEYGNAYTDDEVKQVAEAVQRALEDELGDVAQRRAMRA